MKLEFPHWDDRDPLRLVSRAEQLFQYHRTLTDLKVEITSISFDGYVIQWFDWLVACRRNQHRMNF
jgi:hypothetical protein